MSMKPSQYERSMITTIAFTFFFFFQAEDGIRDYKVTGVQTCALPICLAALWKARLRDLRPVSALELGLRDAICGLNMGETAEVLARRFHVTRQEQDAYALESHRRAVAARERLRQEIVPVYPPPRFQPVLDDIGPREDQTLEQLARLKPAFDREW